MNTSATAFPHGKSGNDGATGRPARPQPAIIPAGRLPAVIGKHASANFLGSVFTPWHAVGIDATIRWLQSRGVAVKGLCLIHPDISYGLACGESAFVNGVSEYVACEKPPRACGVFRYIARLCRLLIARRLGADDSDTIYIASTYVNTRLAVIASSLLHRRVRLITIDEGVGIYLGTFDTPAGRRHHSSSPLSMAGAMLSRLGSALRDKLFGVANNRLFIRRGNVLRLNERIVPFYKGVIEERAAKIAGAFAGRLSLAGTVLICTTAWERSAIAADEDYQVLLRVCAYLHDRGCQIVLKPHPRDKFFAAHADDLHARTLEHSYPIEALCALSQPLAVVGFSSTSLVTARLFWHIPAFCLADMLDMSLIGDVYQRETASFKRVFGSFVAFPKTPADIRIPSP